MADELISVIIPTYNTNPEWLSQAIGSVINQSYQEIELIVVDDCSRLPFSGVKERFSDPRIVWLKNEKNLGVSATRNRAARQAKGEYLAFLDSDDYWEFDKLRLQMDVMLSTNCVWSYTSVVVIDHHGEVKNTLHADLSGFVYRDVLLSQIITGSCSGVVISQRVFDELGGFDSNNDLIEDWDMWIRVAKNHKVAKVDTPLVYLRWYSSGRRGINSKKIDRINNMHKKYQKEIDQFKLGRMYASHINSVKAKSFFIHKNFLLAIYYGLISLLQDLSIHRLILIFRWFYQIKYMK